LIFTDSLSDVDELPGWATITLPPVCLTHMHNDLMRSPVNESPTRSAVTGTSDVHLLCHLHVKHKCTSCKKTKQTSVRVVFIVVDEMECSHNTLWMSRTSCSTWV